MTHLGRSGNTDAYTRAPTHLQYITGIFNFFETLFSDGKGHNSINCYKSALPSVLPPVQGFDIGCHPLVCMLPVNHRVWCAHKPFFTHWVLNILELAIFQLQLTELSGLLLCPMICSECMNQLHLLSEAATSFFRRRSILWFALQLYDCRLTQDSNLCSAG